MNIRFKFDYPKGFPWLAPLIQEEFGATLKRAGDGQLAAYGKQYVIEDAIATGKTFSSFNVSDVENLGDRMQITVAPRGDRGQIASYIEWGRGPNKSGNPSPQMIANIKEWAEAKGIIPAGVDLKKDRAANTIVQSVATVVAREGLDPRLILDKAERTYRPQIVRMFEAATRRLARRINAKITLSHN